MSVLSRKLLRDLRGDASTLLSVVAIIVVGTATFVGLRSSQRILEASQAAYYRDYRFADFWVDVKKAPVSAAEQIAKMPEIDALEARVVFDVILDLPDVVKPLAGRLISTPPRGLAQTINGICLVRGSGFSEDRDEEAIVSEAFAAAHGLEVGDRIHLILNRKRESFVIVGTAISPEYVYMVRGPGDLIPDPEHFGTLYVKERFAREVLDFQDAFNQLVGRLTPGALGHVDAALERVDRVLTPYGVLEVVPRRRQASHRFLSDEITGLRVSATVMPTVFLAVAALVLNILMVRLAQRQRSIVGTLKALGYSNRAMMVHFLMFGVVIGTVGGLVGGALGILLARGMIGMYKEFFQFPSFLFRAYPDLVLTGVAMSIGFAVAGAIRGVRAVLRLQPAEAMRERPPERGGAIFLERWPWLWRQFGFRTHMALRSVFRNRTRTATAIVAAALSTAIIFMSVTMYDSFLYLVDYQFEALAHSDADIGMRDEKSLPALFEARRLPGVDYAEPVLGVRCDLRHGRSIRRMTVTGLNPRHRLTTPRYADGTPVRIPEEGLVLSHKLAELLGVDAGDRLELTPVRGRRVTVEATVAAVAETFIGLDCYADIRYLSGLVGEAFAINALQLSVNRPELPALYRRVKELPNAQGLSVRADAKANIEQTLIATSVFSIGILVLFAGVIGLGSAVSAALVEIGDRVRELSTLRVVGYHPSQVAGVLIRQGVVTSVTGLILAFPIGYVLVRIVAAAYDSELYRMPVIIRARDVILTLALALLFAIVAQGIVYRQIKRLDWLTGVKVKE